MTGAVPGIQARADLMLIHAIAPSSSMDPARAGKRADIRVRRTAAMLTHARAPSSRGKHSGRITTNVTTVITSRRSARMLSAPA